MQIINNPNQLRVVRWMQDGQYNVPQVPTVPDIAMRRLCARLLLEEVLETIVDGLGLHVHVKDGDYVARLTPDMFKTGAIEFHAFQPVNLVYVADGCADTEWVTHWTSSACGINAQPVYDNIAESNESKYEWTSSELLSVKQSGHNTIIELPRGRHCVRDRGGKMMKPTNYIRTNLKPILIAQGATNL
jgi:hypothetical protein